MTNINQKKAATVALISDQIESRPKKKKVYVYRNLRQRNIYIYIYTHIYTHTYVISVK